jgi:hypothetical protein
MNDVIKKTMEAGALLASQRALAKAALQDADIHIIRQLFISGPTWDGDIIDKTARDRLIASGAVVRAGGWSQLSEFGFETAIKVGFGRVKETWAASRRAAS